MVPFLVIVLIIFVVGFYAKDLILMRSKPDLEPIDEAEKEKQVRKNQAENDQTEVVYDTCDNLKFIYKGKSYPIEHGMVIGRGDDNTHRLNLCPLSEDTRIHRDFAVIKKNRLKGDEYCLKKVFQLKKLRKVYVVENGIRRQVRGYVSIQAGQQFIFDSTDYVLEVKKCDALKEKCKASSEAMTTKVMNPTH